MWLNNEQKCGVTIETYVFVIQLFDFEDNNSIHCINIRYIFNIFHWVDDIEIYTHKYYSKIKGLNFCLKFASDWMYNLIYIPSRNLFKRYNKSDIYLFV